MYAASELQKDYDLGLPIPGYSSLLFHDRLRIGDILRLREVIANLIGSHIVEER
jgi:hypothetical protein